MPAAPSAPSCLDSEGRFAETDPRRQLAAYADTQPGVWSRVGPLLRVLDAAAGTDAALVELQEGQAQQRLGGLRRFGAALAATGALRPGLNAERAGDLIWTICAQANYDALVTALGWSHQEYRDWLSDTLAASLLGGPVPDPAADAPMLNRVPPEPRSGR